MSCCSVPDFERHSDANIADIGKGGGTEFTVGRCRNCGAVLVHCWVGGVAGGIGVVSQDWLDRVVAADPEPRRAMLTEWFESL